jgi:hypothetical protein
MTEHRVIAAEHRGESKLSVVVRMLSILAIGTGCASSTDRKISNTANGVQSAANAITNSVNAMNAASEAVAKATHVGAATTFATSSLPAPQGSPHYGPASACAIDDMSDGNNRILTNAGRGGYWYSYVDSAGSTITPPAGAPFIMSPVSEPNVAGFAARFLGNMSTAQIIYAGIGFTLTQPKGAYDASRYTGVSFWAKASVGSTKNVRFKIPDVSTDPDGKVCTGCYNDFGTDLVLTESWNQYVIRFSDLTQLSGWGAPHVPRITQAALYAMQWQISSPGTGYDIALRNLSFTGCGEETASSGAGAPPPAAEQGTRAQASTGEGKPPSDAGQSIPKDGVANAAIDDGFKQWSSTWMFDRYVPGSAHATERGYKGNTYIIRGVFDFVRGAGAATIPFAAAFTSSGESYRLSNLCYSDNTSGMVDCIDPSDPRGLQLAAARSQRFLGSIVTLGLIAGMASSGGEVCEKRYSFFGDAYYYCP